MRVEAWTFAIVAIFMIPVTVIYYVMTDGEPVGVVALIMCFALLAMIAGYLALISVKMPKRPEDRKDGEIVEAAGELGFFPPRSIWPFFLALSITAFCLGPIFGWWIPIVVGAFGIVSLTGWVFEFYRGDYAH